jgi:hypothetical protein
LCFEVSPSGGAPEHLAKHIGGRLPTFYFHLQFAEVASTGGSKSLMLGLRIHGSEEAQVSEANR